MTVDERIKRYFITQYSFVDFFYAYCEDKGIDDPEVDLTDEQYDAWEKLVEQKLTVQFLANMRRDIEQYIDEQIKIAVREF